MTLELTRDRHDVVQAGFGIPASAGPFDSQEQPTAKEGSLKSLSTSKGVAIGNDPSKVMKLLGPPISTAKSGSRNQFLDYHYSWKSGGTEEDRAYDETYTFKAGKLIEITFDAGPAA